MAEPGRLLLDEQEIAARVETAAKALAPLIDDETVAVCLLTGGIWYAADLMRALARLGVHPLFDAVWLGSYGDERVSGGKVNLRAGLQRDLTGRRVLLIDDVLDSGFSLLEAKRVVAEAGAEEILITVFADKPWPTPRAVFAEVAAWEAPAEFLIGYGLDDAGRYRGLPQVRSL
jgi:hypoxanthine phosphoribosyltransferase